MTTNPMPSLATLRLILANASSASKASKALGIHRDRLAAYCRATTDQELRSLYRACVERGKRKDPEPMPRFAVYMSCFDTRTSSFEWVRIWGVDASDATDAMEIALRATGRRREDLKVEREERK